MTRKAFTLTELVAVVAIVGAIGAIAISGFLSMKTKAEKNQAIAYMRNVRTAEKMYYGKWKTYLTRANTAQIQNELRVESKLPSYSFAVTAASQSFSVASTNSSGKTITLNETGSWGGTNTPLPPGVD